MLDPSEIVLEKREDMDWSTPLVNQSTKAETLEFDWGQPINGKSDTLELKWSDDENSESEGSDDGITMKETSRAEIPAVVPEAKVEMEQETGGLDIMAQQLKFVACLKILMGEMATLATGFEVDGGQLRLQLYLWLDRELQVCYNYYTFKLSQYKHNITYNIPTIQLAGSPATMQLCPNPNFGKRNRRG